MYHKGGSGILSAGAIASKKATAIIIVEIPDSARTGRETRTLCRKGRVSHENH